MPQISAHARRPTSHSHGDQASSSSGGRSPRRHPDVPTSHHRDRAHRAVRQGDKAETSTSVPEQSDRTSGGPRRRSWPQAGVAGGRPSAACTSSTTASPTARYRRVSLRSSGRCQPTRFESHEFANLIALCPLCRLRHKCYELVIWLFRACPASSRTGWLGLTEEVTGSIPVPILSRRERPYCPSDWTRHRCVSSPQPVVTIRW